jgi:hypothetical protein
MLLLSNLAFLFRAGASFLRLLSRRLMACVLSLVRRLRRRTHDQRNCQQQRGSSDDS